MLRLPLLLVICGVGLLTSGVVAHYDGFMPLSPTAVNNNAAAHAPPAAAAFDGNPFPVPQRTVGHNCAQRIRDWYDALAPAGVGGVRPNIGASMMGLAIAGPDAHNHFHVYYTRSGAVDAAMAVAPVIAALGAGDVALHSAVAVTTAAGNAPTGADRTTMQALLHGAPVAGGPGLGGAGLGPVVPPVGAHRRRCFGSAVGIWNNAPAGQPTCAVTATAHREIERTFQPLAAPGGVAPAPVVEQGYPAGACALPKLVWAITHLAAPLNIVCAAELTPAPAGWGPATVKMPRTNAGVATPFHQGQRVSSCVTCQNLVPLLMTRGHCRIAAQLPPANFNLNFALHDCPAIMMEGDQCNIPCAVGFDYAALDPTPTTCHNGQIRYRQCHSLTMQCVHGVCNVVKAGASVGWAALGRATGLMFSTEQQPAHSDDQHLTESVSPASRHRLRSRVFGGGSDFALQPQEP